MKDRGEFESQEYEDREREFYIESLQAQEPNVAPCFKCRAQMYQKSCKPEENLCFDCWATQSPLIINNL